MILFAGSVRATRVEGSAPRLEERFADAGGLSRLKFNIATLAPGERSSMRHWHEEADEFLYLIEGEATIVENDGRHVIGPGDICCWPAGVPNAHHVLNLSDEPIRYLVASSEPATDICHYPDDGRRLHHRPPRWWIEDESGHILREGATD